jgi:phage shock protein PspC (stress-responsive transcriptional regulator)
MLYRSCPDEKMLSGCGYLAKYLDIDPNIISVMATASILAGTVGT